MSTITKNIALLRNHLLTKKCALLVVTKNQPLEKITEAYQVGQRDFGENRVQEMVTKRDALPDDIIWHMIGHLQRNKVKYIASFISLIHSIDSRTLLDQVNKEGEKMNRCIPCLLQLFIAREDSKYGMTEQEIINILENASTYPFIKFKGLMGMATLTEDSTQIRHEFNRLNQFYLSLKGKPYQKNITFEELSMGMSSDYPIAIEEGSTLVRIGRSIFENSPPLHLKN